MSVFGSTGHIMGKKSSRKNPHHPSQEAGDIHENSEKRTEEDIRKDEQEVAHFRDVAVSHPFHP